MSSNGDSLPVGANAIGLEVAQLSALDSPASHASVHAANRNAQILSMYAKGYSLGDISSVLQIPRKVVSRFLSLAVARVSAQADGNAKLIRARELIKLNELEKQYWAAWERSTGGVETEIDERKSVLMEAQPQAGADSAQNIARRSLAKREKSHGNPQYLAGVERVIRLRLELLGQIEKAAQVVIENNTTTTTNIAISENNQFISMTSDERMERVMEIIQKARQRNALTALDEKIAAGLALQAAPDDEDGEVIDHDDPAMANFDPDNPGAAVEKQLAIANGVKTLAPPKIADFFAKKSEENGEISLDPEDFL